jgi:uncharacterized protein (TIGR00369 family)
LDHAIETARAIFRAAPFVADLGIEPTAVAAGRCETQLVLQPRLMQHTGQAHAGVVATLADHTAGAAAQSTLPAGALAITAEMKVSLMRPATGERLVCTAVVVKGGRTIVFTESEVHAIQAGERRLVAKFSATMAVVATKATP